MNLVAKSGINRRHHLVNLFDGSALALKRGAILCLPLLTSPEIERFAAARLNHVLTMAPHPAVFVSLPVVLSDSVVRVEAFFVVTVAIAINVVTTVALLNVVGFAHEAIGETLPPPALCFSLSRQLVGLADFGCL